MLRAAVKLTSLRRLNVFREFSEVVRKKFDVKQGGGVFIDFHKSNGVTIEISTAWQDHCDIEYDSDSSWKDFSLKFTEKAAEKGGKQKLFIEAAVPDSCTTLEMSPMKCLKLVIPEMFDVSIIAHHLDLRVKNKLLGDFIVQSNSGTIEVDKLRGTKLVISCPESDIVVNKLLEGSSYIEGKSLKAKMINGEEVQLISSGSISVEAMYSLESMISTETGDVHIGLMQGNTNVSTTTGDVSILGLDGSFDVAVQKGNITLGINKVISSSKQPMSSALAANGNVHATVDPEVEAGVSIDSFSSAVQILSDAFVRGPANPSNPDSVTGVLTGLSMGLKRPTFYRGEGSSGKIDKRVADSQSMQSVSPSGGDQIASQICLKGSGSIKLETLSWIEAIRRKHLTGGHVMPEIPLGKKALAYQKMETPGDEIVEQHSEVPPVAESEASVTLNLDNIPGMQSEGEKYVIMFTCNVCEKRSAKKISKKSYHTGVVICRCEGCNNLHLIADRMGVFEDESWDVQKYMTDMLEREDIDVNFSDNLVEVTKIDVPDDSADMGMEELMRTAVRTASDSGPGPNENQPSP